MNHSKNIIEAAGKTRAARALAAANHAAGLDASATAKTDLQRTPYARNWLMSLGWLATSATVGDAQSKASVSRDALTRKRSRTPPPVAGGRPAEALATARKLTVTAPAPLPLLVEAEPAVVAPRLTLRTWLSALTGSRQPEPEQPEPVVGIAVDRMAQVLRSRSQTRPKWTVPANDKGRDPGSDPLPI